MLIFNAENWNAVVEILLVWFTLWEGIPFFLLLSDRWLGTSACNHLIMIAIVFAQIMSSYYMASTVNEEMNQIRHFDWLPKQARWHYLALARLPAISGKKNSVLFHVINPLLLFFTCLWSSTLSQTTNTEKELYKADIQPSRPNVWSIARYILEIQRLGINENNIFTCLAKPEHDLYAKCSMSKLLWSHLLILTFCANCYFVLDCFIPLQEHTLVGRPDAAHTPVSKLKLCVR